jgi:hypothetical protein
MDFVALQDLKACKANAARMGLKVRAALRVLQGYLACPATKALLAMWAMKACKAQRVGHLTGKRLAPCAQEGQLPR